MKSQAHFGLGGQIYDNFCMKIQVLKKYDEPILRYF